MGGRKTEIMDEIESFPRIVNIKLNWNVHCVSHGLLARERALRFVYCAHVLIKQSEISIL